MTDHSDFEKPPLEFVKDRISQLFKELKAEQTNSSIARVTEKDIEKLVTTAMAEATNKYPDHLLPKHSIHREEFLKTA